MIDADLFFFALLVAVAALVYLMYARHSLQRRLDVAQIDAAEFERRERLLHDLLDNAPGPIALKDRDAKFLFSNRHFASIHGLTPDQVVGMNVRDLYPPDKVEFFLSKDRELLKTGELSHNEVEAVDADGERIVYLTQRFPVRDDFGEIVAIGTTNAIVTTLKETEAELTRYREYLEDLVKERTAELEVLNDQKDKFFSIIAHDLRGPFNALLGYSRLLHKDISKFDQDQIVEFAGTMNEAAEIVFKLLENLLEWTRLQMDGAEINTGPVDIKALIDQNFELFRPVAAAKEISISSTTCQPATVLADTDMVDAILRNLINNALKFTPSGGRVSVDVEARGGEIRTEVRDNGIGISAQDLEHLFRLDHKSSGVGTNGETGTGLGLQLCKELAEKQNGTLAVESTPQSGTTITFTLPVWPDQPPGA